MTTSAEFNLELAAGRSCHWAPDYAWLSLLKPAQGRVLNIGPRLTFSTADAANQTLAASVTTQVPMAPGSITPGSWTPPTGNQAYFFESISWSIAARDASAKLQILNIATANVGGCPIAIQYSFPLPCTLVINGSFMSWVGIAPVILLLGSSPTPNGPASFVAVTNTDTSSHVYSRSFFAAYRVIDGIDFTTGPSIPGSGVGR